MIGAGAWGTTIASMVAANTSTVLWSRRPELAEQINTTRVNGDYLPEVTLSNQFVATSSLREAVMGADVIAMAVPSHGFRDVARAIAQYLRPDAVILSLSKGLEGYSGLRMTEVAAQELPGRCVGVLTGPNLAFEVLAGQPTGSVIAFADIEDAEAIQPLFTSPNLRIYTNTDVIGCEVAGVVKNVIAIAAGMAEGMGFGENSKATLITRGLAEMTRLGLAIGGDPMTFSGLAGIGDLVATCSSKQSRNKAVGLELGRGRAIADVIASKRTVAEGIRSSASVLDLAHRYGVEMPITEQVVAVCHEGRSVEIALTHLMSRSNRSELG